MQLQDRRPLKNKWDGTFFPQTPSWLCYLTPHRFHHRLWLEHQLLKNVQVYEELEEKVDPRQMMLRCEFEVKEVCNKRFFFSKDHQSSRIVISVSIMVVSCSCLSLSLRSWKGNLRQSPRQSSQRWVPASNYPWDTGTFHYSTTGSKKGGHNWFHVPRRRNGTKWGSPGRSNHSHHQASWKLQVSSSNLRYCFVFWLLRNWNGFPRFSATCKTYAIICYRAQNHFLFYNSAKFILGWEQP